MPAARRARTPAGVLGRGFGTGFGHTDVTTEWIFPIAIAVSSLSCFCRFLIETLLVSQRLGVLSIMTRKMLSDNLVQWGVIMVIVLIAFGLAFVAIAPEYVAEPRAPVARDGRSPFASRATRLLSGPSAQPRCQACTQTVGLNGCPPGSQSD